MDNIEDFNGEQGADIAETLANTPDTAEPQPQETIEEYVADAPQLAAPLHSRTAHYGFRRGRI